MEKTQQHQTHGRARARTHAHTHRGRTAEYQKVQFAKLLLGGGGVIMSQLQNVQQRFETNKLRAINLCLDGCGGFFFYFVFVTREGKQLRTRLMHMNYFMQMSELFSFILDKLVLNGRRGGAKELRSPSCAISERSSEATLGLRRYL